MTKSYFTEEQLIDGGKLPSVTKPKKIKKEIWKRVTLNGVDCMVSSRGRYGIIFQSSMNKQ